jgi:hypothetical protein
VAAKSQTTQHSEHARARADDPTHVDARIDDRGGHLLGVDDGARDRLDRGVEADVQALCRGIGELERKVIRLGVDEAQATPDVPESEAFTGGGVEADEIIEREDDAE